MRIAILSVLLLGACTRYVPLNSGHRWVGDIPENREGYYAEQQHLGCFLPAASWETGRIIGCEPGGKACRTVYGIPDTSATFAPPLACRDTKEVTIGGKTERWCDTPQGWKKIE